MTDAVFLRLLSSEEKSATLLDAIRSIRGDSKLPPVAFFVDPVSFHRIPGAPFAYWVGERIRRLFHDLPQFDKEDEGRATRCGLGTLDDFRFLRLYWEISPQTQRVEWSPYYHGGVYSSIFDEFPMVVRWSKDGTSIKRFVAEKVGSASRKVQGEDHYFLAGFIFPRRTRAFSPKAMPAGGIFSTAGQAGFLPTEDLEWGLALLSSSICNFLISLSQGTTSQELGGTNPQFEVGLVKRLPWPTVAEAERTKLSALARAIFRSKQSVASAIETSRAFSLPACLHTSGGALVERIENWNSEVKQIERDISRKQDEIDEIGFKVYGIGAGDRRAVEELMTVTSASAVETTEEEDEGQELIAVTDRRLLVAELVSYALGCTVGRWDVRLATGERPIPELPDPFAPLPVYSPGILTEQPRDYPLTIDRDGILPDDPDHPDDIMRRVHEVFSVIWRERAEVIEQEACAILGVKELRDYFRKPAAGGFWADHIACYSKSRRKAPIYWLLQSGRKNYALWVFNHRLDGDTLSKALINYVEPKLRLEENRLNELRSQRTQAGGAVGAARALDRQIERQEDLLSELNDFADKLRRVIALHLTPDLNDGIVLNIAPLRELVPWKEAKKYWDELLAGKYNWSSIAQQLKAEKIGP